MGGRLDADLLNVICACIKVKVKIWCDKVNTMPRAKRSTRGGARPGAGRKPGSKNRIPAYLRLAGAFGAVGADGGGGKSMEVDANNNAEAGQADDDEVQAIQRFLQEEGYNEDNGGNGVAAAAAAAAASAEDAEEGVADHGNDGGRGPVAAAAAVASGTAAASVEDRQDGGVGFRRSRRSRRATSKILAARAMDKAATRATELAAARRAEREQEQGQHVSLSQAMSSQTTDDREARNLTGREWRNRAILRNLRRGFSAKVVSSMYRLSPSSVWDIRRHFLKTGNVVPPKKPRPKFKPSTLQKRAVIRRKIQRNPCRSIRGLAISAGMAFNTARRVIASLGMRSHARVRRQALTPQHKHQRKVLAAKIINKLKKKPPHAPVFHSDECHVATDAFRNSRWDRVLVKAGTTAMDVENDLGINRRHQRPPGHMAWGCTASDGKSQLLILPRKTSLNSANFIQKILVPHVSWLKSTYTKDQLRGAIWIQDGARCHTAAATEAWIRDKMERELGMVVIGKARGEWPARSPDLNCLDWCCWGPFKKRVQGYMGVPHINLLPGRMRRNWPLVITEDFVKRQMKKFRNRLQRVIDNDGGYIE